MMDPIYACCADLDERGMIEMDECRSALAGEYLERPAWEMPAALGILLACAIAIRALWRLR